MHPLYQIAIVLMWALIYLAVGGVVTYVWTRWLELRRDRRSEVYRLVAFNPPMITVMYPVVITILLVWYTVAGTYRFLAPLRRVVKRGFDNLLYFLFAPKAKINPEDLLIEETDTPSNVTVVDERVAIDCAEPTDAMMDKIHAAVPQQDFKADSDALIGPVDEATASAIMERIQDVVEKALDDNPDLMDRLYEAMKPLRTHPYKSAQVTKEEVDELLRQIEAEYIPFNSNKDDMLALAADMIRTLSGYAYDDARMKESITVARYCYKNNCSLEEAHLALGLPMNSAL